MRDRAGKAPATQRASINDQGKEKKENRTLQILATTQTLLAQKCASLIGDADRWKHTFTWSGFPLVFCLIQLVTGIRFMTISELSKA